MQRDEEEQQRKEQSDYIKDYPHGQVGMSFRFVTIYYEMLQQQQQQESVLYEEVGNSSTVVGGETENPTIVTIPVADGHP